MQRWKTDLSKVEATGGSPEYIVSIQILFSSAGIYWRIFQGNLRLAALAQVRACLRLHDAPRCTNSGIEGALHAVRASGLDMTFENVTAVGGTHYVSQLMHYYDPETNRKY